MQRNVCADDGEGRQSQPDESCSQLGLSFELEVCFDRQSIRQQDKQSFQERMGFITEEAVIFSDTTFNKVTFFQDKLSPEKQQRHYGRRRTEVADFHRSGAV